MCDTICVLPKCSNINSTIFAKNSDRDPNEPHVIRYIPRKNRSEKLLKCTYIKVPEVECTNAVLLFKPNWIWGAEMGINEHSVVIGNEAVFTKARKGRDSLIGMDLLRLALERADTAEMALEVILQLLDKYGQGGNCGFGKDFRYDNSFLIADTKKAYKLETAGKDYAAVEVLKKDAISNGLSIKTEHTSRKGIVEGQDFTKKYNKPIYTHFAKSKERRIQSINAISNSSVDISQMFKALRTHNPDLEGHEFEKGSVSSVCMHAGGLIGDHTTGSFVVVLRKDAPMTIWATGASTPCISAFKPIFFGIDSGSPIFANEDAGRRYWLKREHLHRAVLAGRVDVEKLRLKRDKLETMWMEEETGLFASGIPSSEQLREFAARASCQEEALINEFACDDWESIVGNRYFVRYWRKKNKALK